MDFFGDVLWLCCGWIIVGALAGAFARQIMGAKDKPFFNDLLLGIAGAIVGGILLRLFFGDRDALGLGRVIGTLVTATFGAMLLIFAGRMIFGGRRRR